MYSFIGKNILNYYYQSGDLKRRWLRRTGQPLLQQLKRIEAGGSASSSTGAVVPPLVLLMCLDEGGGRPHRDGGRHRRCLAVTSQPETGVAPVVEVAGQGGNSEKKKKDEKLITCFCKFDTALCSLGGTVTMYQRSFSSRSVCTLGNCK